MAGKKKRSTEAAVRQIRRRTRRKFTPDTEKAMGEWMAAHGAKFQRA
jgi:hypothetical protein